MKIGRCFLCMIMACVLVLSVTGCTGKTGSKSSKNGKTGNLDGSKTDRITYLYFISCTEWSNSFLMDENHLGEKWKAGLRSSSSKKLISTLEALPNTENTDGELAFIIRLKYMEDGVEKTLERSGYDVFPDNWQDIIDLINKTANGYATAGNGTTISKVDVDFVREHERLYLDESVLPEELTLEDLIRDMPITYLTLYDPENGWEMSIQREICKYLFDYFDLGPNRVMELNPDPPKSTTDELLSFAKEHMDTVYDSRTGKSVSGEYNGVKYEIVKYDEFQDWYDQYDFYAIDTYKRKLSKNSDGMRYDIEEYGPDNGTMMVFSLYRDLYVDASGKFIILAEANRYDYKDIVKLVK